MNFEIKKNEFFERLGETCYMVLATCQNDSPMASTMTCLVFDDAIWMQTDKKFDKYNQLLANNRVALVKNATQIEGIAQLCGHPLDTENAKFAQLMKKHHPESYEMYSTVETEVVIKVTPHKAVDWLYEAGDSSIYHIDFVKQEISVQTYKNGK